MLALKPELITKDVMQTALSTLRAVKVLPDWQSTNTIKVIQEAISGYA